MQKEREFKLPTCKMSPGLQMVSCSLSVRLARLNYSIPAQVIILIATRGRQET